MKIRLAFAKVGDVWCAHGFEGATDEQLAAAVRSKKVADKVAVRFVTVEIPAEAKRALKAVKTRRAA